MSRYIDADVLIESIKNTADLGGWIGEALYQIKQVAIKYINSAPSIDIVRCKECKWRGEEIESGNPYYWCRLVGVGYEVPFEHFCSYGEREGE